MQAYKLLSLLTVPFLIFCWSCTTDDDFTAVNLPTEAGDIQLNFRVSDDDSGDVTVVATGAGFQLFSFFFGDVEDEEPTVILPGRDVTHTYPEGTFTMKVIGQSAGGSTQEMTQEIVVSFTPPANLVTNIAIDNRDVTVTPEADNAAVFEIFFGDVDNEEPTVVMPGSSADHTYAEDGQYVIRTVARSASVNTLERKDTIQVELLTEPETAAPTPTQADASVISMFSDAYTDVAVDTWRTVWSDADFEDVVLAGSAVKKYSNLNFVGIETTSTPIDASAMTHFSLDVWTANITEFRIKLVDFGADGVFGGGDDVEHEISITDPVQTSWVSLDIPLSDFTGLTTRSSIQQLIFSGDPSGSGVVFIDNIYFYAEGPQTTAPVPTQNPDVVVSMFSNAYTDVTVDTWLTVWSVSDFEDVVVAGDDVKKYDNLNFAGIETISSPIDASDMTHFSVDIWSASSTTFRIKLVDFGADAVFGGGDDVEHEISVENNNPATWVSLDIPLSDFTGLVTRASIQQLIFSSDPAGASTLFIDNIYFYSDQPLTQAPVPSQAPASVISMFSEAYTDVTVDTWRTVWSESDFEDVTVAGGAVKKYSNLNFVGIETTSAPIDASAMTHFSLDFWTPNSTELRVKLVDFGADGIFGGGDDVEHEIAITAPAQGEWVSLDIPLSDFTGLVTRASIQQLIFSSDPSGTSTVFVDNIYFYSN